jgi:hypothetical protein
MGGKGERKEKLFASYRAVEHSDGRQVLFVNHFVNSDKSNSRRASCNVRVEQGMDGITPAG